MSPSRCPGWSVHCLHTTKRFSHGMVHIEFNLQENLCKMATLKKQKLVFQDQLSLNAGQSIAECSNGSILQYFRLLPIFEWPFYTGLTVY